MTPQNILSLCSIALDVPVAVILSKDRTEKVAFARHVAFYIMRESCTGASENKMSYTAIGRLVGRRDHGTVMHGVGRIANLPKNSKLQLKVAQLLSQAKLTVTPQIAELIGHRLLLHTAMNGKEEVFEAKVERLSPNNNFVCLTVNGERSWGNVNNFTVLDILSSNGAVNKPSISD